MTHHIWDGKPEKFRFSLQYIVNLRDKGHAPPLIPFPDEEFGTTLQNTMSGVEDEGTKLNVAAEICKQLLPHKVDPAIAAVLQRVEQVLKSGSRRLPLSGGRKEQGYFLVEIQDLHLLRQALRDLHKEGRLPFSPEAYLEGFRLCDTYKHADLLPNDLMVMQDLDHRCAADHWATRKGGEPDLPVGWERECHGKTWKYWESERCHELSRSTMIGGGEYWEGFGGVFEKEALRRGVADAHNFQTHHFDLNPPSGLFDAGNITLPDDITSDEAWNQLSENMQEEAPNL
ncbi:hypothetical protein F4780DRAFT_744759 [Xylariomycetidae sp. FL0641]|nr:hypothetical protein F4780DRAFT_744759 [Xylariomycetidae sp. FL0641]